VAKTGGFTDQMLLIQSFGIWLIIGACAFLNGAIREKFIAFRIGEQPAHVISSIILAVLVFLVASFFIRAKSITEPNKLLLIGGFWVILTMSFEFLFFHYVVGEPWSELLADYNIFKGRIFVLVLLSQFLSPIIASTFFLNQ
jgi:hypothetical protein